MMNALLPARRCNFTAIDFETTGSVKAYPIEPWQVGLVAIKAGEICIASAFESLLQVGPRPFHPQAPGAYHMLREKLLTAPTLHQLWPQLGPHVLGKVLVAHQIGTERKFLSKAAPLHPLGPWVDTLKLSRLAYPHLPSYTLQDLIDTLHLKNHVERFCPARHFHDALFDAIACAVLLRHLLHLPGWEEVSLSDLV